MAKWRETDVPDLSGRTAIVTGANSGLGFETARVLARRGARVVLACRNPVKARVAEAAIRSVGPAGSVSAMALDLASLASVGAFAEAFLASYGRLDLLVDNGGVMAIGQRRSADGFELQLATNHLGHFALTGLLLARLLETPGSRVVGMSSSAHRFGRIDFDDLQSERRYGPWRAYAQSKLANLLFVFELQRRLERKGAATIAVACHPGYAATQLQLIGPRMRKATLMTYAIAFGNRFVAQSAPMGALSTLYAATAPEVRGGDYFGPDAWFELRGHPKRVGTSARARDESVAARLWEVSEKLTGVRYEALV